MPPPTEQLSPLKKLWRSRIIEDVAAFPDLTRAGFLHSLLLGAPWTIAVHVTDTKRIWVAPTPLPLTFAYAGHADVWLMYSAGTLTMLKLMASKAAALPNVSLIHLHTDNCGFAWVGVYGHSAVPPPLPTATPCCAPQACTAGAWPWSNMRGARRLARRTSPKNGLRGWVVPLPLLHQRSRH